MRKTKTPTAQSLKNAALHYLGRYAASEAGLRRVLQNRLRKAAMLNPSFAADAGLQAELRSAIEMIIETHRKTGVLNDAAFAETKIAALRRQGRSGYVIRRKLALKGVAPSIVKKALEEDAGGMPNEEVEFKAALALARRRKWGPFRKTSDPDLRRKDFAALARAGFSADIARRVSQADIESDIND